MKDTQKWTKSKIFLVAFNCILCISIIVSSMVIVIDKSRMKNGVVYAGKTDTVPVATSAKPKATTTKPEFKGITTARLMCAGDNLIHRGIYNEANEYAEGNGYDFSHAYEKIKDIITSADLAFINAETIMDPNTYPSSYPVFNTPTEMLDALTDAGFDIFNQANNHCLDMGENGALRDIELFSEKSDAMLTGLYETREDMLTPQTTVVNDIIFSFLGVTESVENNCLDDESALGLLYFSDIRRTEDEIYATMRQMIENAKKVSDVVCVSVHWETEEISEPDESQREIVEKLLKYGADIIIGTGPQVLQPMEFMKNSDGEDALVIWSLGNFISCNSDRDKLLGGIADIKISKDFDKKTVTVSSAKIIPTITHYESDYTDIQVIPLSEYTSEKSESHGVNAYTDDFNLETLHRFYADMYSDRVEYLS